MNRLKKKIIAAIIVLLLLVLCNESLAGYEIPQQNIALRHSTTNDNRSVKVEVWKWVGGLVTVLAGAGLTYYLNNKKKKINNAGETKAGEEIKVSDENKVEFQEEFSNLLNEEIDIKFDLISIGDLGDISMSTNDIIPIQKFHKS